MESSNWILYHSLLCTLATAVYNRDRMAEILITWFTLPVLHLKFWCQILVLENMFKDMFFLPLQQQEKAA